MRRKALLLTTTPKTTEMEELVYAMGAVLVGTCAQRRPQPDPQLFLGSGKMEEVRAQARAGGVGLVVVNGELKPGQIFAMQRFLSDGAGDTIEVFDRTRLILEIFRERARSPEARLQVELAQLHYEMPLVRESISASKRGERQAAQFGAGEYEADVYYDMMKRRMARIRRDLEKMRRERGVRRKHRRRSGFHLVSLAGYTNAGKSSLLQALSHERALIENRYFSTLSTKTARARSDRREILLTDTVGFIEALPPWMIDAFHSTLEEIALADVILLVLDASDPLPEMARRLRSSLSVLWDFDSSSADPAVARARRGEDDAGSRDESGPFTVRRGLAPILVALNKVDRAAPGEVEAKQRALEEEGLLPPGMSVPLSAVTGEGLEALYERLYELIPDYDEYEVALPPAPESESLLAWLHESTDVLDMTRGNETHVHFEAKRSLRMALQEKLDAVGATKLREVVRETHQGSLPEGGADPVVPSVEDAAAPTPAEDVQDGVIDASSLPKEHGDVA